MLASLAALSGSRATAKDCVRCSPAAGIGATKMGRLGLVVAAGLAVLLHAPVATRAQAPRADRPTFAVGDQWILKDGPYDLIKIEKDRYIFAAGAGRQIHVSKDLALVSVLRDRIWEWDLDPVPAIPWPLQVGKWGTVYGAILHTRENPAGVKVRVTWEVKAYEAVQVVAGEFKAFRILYTVDLEDTDTMRRRWNVPGPQYWRVETWYAPEAQRIVKSQAVNAPALNFQVVALDQRVAPTLQVLVDEPKEQAHVATDRITVGGKITASSALGRVSIVLNGTEVFVREPRDPPVRELTLSTPITAVEGKNVLLVTADDASGHRRQEARVFFRDRPTPPAGPTPSPPAPLQVTISSPGDQSRVEQENIAVTGVAAGGKDVRRVLVTLNGVEVARLEPRTSQRSVPVNVPLKLRDGQNAVVVTATDVDGTTQQEVRTVNYSRSVPLAVEFRYPEDRARLTDGSSVVAAVVTSSRGVAEVSVLLNGVEVFTQRERAPQASVTVAAPLKLREGSNAIVVRATEAGGAVRQEPRTVTYEPAAVPAPPGAPALAAKADRWAVVIGAGKYASADIPSLRYTVADAEAVYEELVEQGGFKKENVLLLTDKTPRKPTLRDIKWALGTFLARSAKKEDLVVIFFSGHGAPEVDPRGLEPDGLAKYLVPVDADSNDLYSTALPMDEFQTIFDRIEADRVVVFLDACYSGGAGGRTFASKRTRATRVDDLFLDRLTRSKGRAIVTASRSAEVSLELPELGHGIFTYYLVQGLRGTADLDRDGIISLQELYSYVEQQVSQKSRAVGGNQHPMIKGEMEGLLPLMKVRGR